MTERRYTDEEVAAIFERAAEPQQALPASDGKGMTLSALQEIGREVGFSPEAIAEAARGLDRAGHPDEQKLLGFPVGVGRTIEVDRQITDLEWEHLVADARGTFNARGTVLLEGRVRHWVNGNLQLSMEPTATGHRVRLKTLKGDSRALMVSGLVVSATAVATTIATAIGGTLGNSAQLSGVTLLAAIGLGSFGLGALQLPTWARRRRGQMEGVLARHAAAGTALPEG